MRRGAALHLTYERGVRVWFLSSGSKVTDDIAQLVIMHADIVGVGDSLFRNTPNQTYRAAGP
jgi:hypothetical protein